MSLAHPEKGKYSLKKRYTITSTRKDRRVMRCNICGGRVFEYTPDKLVVDGMIYHVRCWEKEQRLNKIIEGLKEPVKLI